MAVFFLHAIKITYSLWRIFSCGRNNDCQMIVNKLMNSLAEAIQEDSKLVLVINLVDKPEPWWSRNFSSVSELDHISMINIMFLCDSTFVLVSRSGNILGTCRQQNHRSVASEVMKLLHPWRGYCSIDVYLTNK